MREFAIRLRSVQDVQEFVDIATAKPFAIQVCESAFDEGEMAEGDDDSMTYSGLLTED